MSASSSPAAKTSPLQPALLDSLFCNSTEAVVVVDDAGAILYSTPGAGLLMDLDTRSTVGTSIFEYIHPDDLQDALEQFGERLTYEGRDMGQPIRIRHGSGQWQSMVVTASLIDEPGCGAAALTLRNVDDQPTVERSLRRRMAVDEAMNRLATMFVDNTAPEDLVPKIETALARVGLLTGAHAISVWLERDAKVLVERVAHWQRKPGAVTVAAHDLTTCGASREALEHILNGSWAVHEIDDSKDPVNQLGSALDVISLLSEPFVTGRQRGVVIATRSVPGMDWSSEDILLTRGLARLLGHVFRSAHNEALLTNMFRDGPHAMAIRSGDGSLVECNQQYLNLFGFTRAEAETSTLWDVIDGEGVQDYIELVRRLRQGEIQRFVEEVPVILAGGESGWLRVSSVRLDEPSGSDVYLLSTLEDITDSYRQREELELHQKRLEQLIDNVPALIFRIDRDSKILLCGPEVRKFGDIQPEDITGLNLLDFIEDPELRDVWRVGLKRVFAEGVMVSDELRMPTPGRQVVFDARAVPEFGPNGTIETVLVVAIDVTYRREIADQLLHAATHDSLTGVANREAMIDRINRLREETGDVPSLVMIDLDRFKLVNDSMGHAGGDEVLRIAARRISQQVREIDLVGRLGGDEFAIVAPDITSEGLTALAERLRTTIETPFSIDGRSVPQTISIGIAAGEPGLDAEDLLVRADRALYAAKAQGRNRYVVFDATLQDKVSAGLTLERELRHAIRHGELEVHFQPEFSLADKRILGAEALLRWQHPTRGLLKAEQFIELAESSGLINEMGRVALRSACSTFAQICATAGRNDLNLRVNISAREFARRELSGLVHSALVDSGLAPEQLCLEMTETTLMDSPEIALETFGRLHEIGVEFAIDDFGTGYSSLTYLKRFPVDAVKIDRSFVEDVTDDPESRAIVESIIGLAKALDLEVVAEGVETEQQADLIRSLGCDRAQGHLVAGALTPEDFIKLVAD